MIVKPIINCILEVRNMNSKCFLFFYFQKSHDHLLKPDGKSDFTSSQFTASLSPVSSEGAY